MVGIDFSSIPASACEICSIRLFGKGTELTSERRLTTTLPEKLRHHGNLARVNFRDASVVSDGHYRCFGGALREKLGEGNAEEVRRSHSDGCSEETPGWFNC